MSMRVLHVDSGSEWRGGQRQLFLLTQGLRELGYEPLVVAPPTTQLAERLRSRGLAVSVTPMRGAWDVTSVRWLRKLLRTWRPDVVHAHDARAHALVLAALAGDFETPLVITRRLPAHPTPLGLQLGGRVARYVAVSRAVRAALIAGRIDPVLIDVIPPAIDPSSGSPAHDWRAQCGWPADAVVCGVVGARSSERGTGSIARIVSRMSERARTRLRLVVLGGARYGRDDIEEIAAFRAGTFDGTESIAGLDLLWHLSSSHGLGTIALDAMALGVPPIAFAVGALPEFIEHQASGVLVQPGDADAFAAAAEGLIVDERARRVLAAGGPARAASFDVRAMVKAHDRVYRSLGQPDAEFPAPSSGSAEQP